MIIRFGNSLDVLSPSPIQGMNMSSSSVRLKVNVLGIESGGKPIIFLNKQDADEIGVTASARVRINSRRRELTAIVNIAPKYLKKGFIGVSEEVARSLSLKRNSLVNI